MSIERFCMQIRVATLSEADRQWFPRWIRRYAEEFHATAGDVPVTQPQVIRFLRTLRDNGTPAWQRLQATRAIEAYQRIVLESQSPSLRAIRLWKSRPCSESRTFTPGERLSPRRRRPASASASGSRIPPPGIVLPGHSPAEHAGAWEFSIVPP
jgi:hypothetical protein